MNRFGVVVLGILSICACAGAQNNPFSKYLFEQNWTPIPNHESYWVPGIILTVDLSSGQIGYLQPMLTSTQKALVLANETGTFDENRSAYTTNGGGAVSGINQLLNGLSINAVFQNNPSVSFSGMAFTGQRVDDWTPITDPSTQVYQTLVQHYGDTRRVAVLGRGVKYAYFLVEEVALGTSAHIVSTTAISGSASFGGAKDTGDCKAPQLPAELAKPAGDAANAQPAPAANDSSKKTDTLADAAKTTSTDTAPKTTGEAADKQSKASAAAASAKFSFCHAGNNELTFASSQPLPVAMKLRLIGSYQDSQGHQTKIDIDQADTPLPIGVDPGKVKCAAQKALHAKFPKFTYPPCIP